MLRSPLFFRRQRHQTLTYPFKALVPLREPGQQMLGLAPLAPQLARAQAG